MESLHRAGADFVMSQDHMGANTIFNLLNHAEILMITEGLDIFSQKTPKSLVGKSRILFVKKRDVVLSL